MIDVWIFTIIGAAWLAVAVSEARKGRLDRFVITLNFVVAGSFFLFALARLVHACEVCCESVTYYNETPVPFTYSHGAPFDVACDWCAADKNLTGCVANATSRGDNKACVPVDSATPCMERKPRMSPEIKARLRSTATGFKTFSTAAAGAALWCSTDPEPGFVAVCNTVVGVLSLASGIITERLTNALDNDPYDAAYASVSQPVLPAMPDISSVRYGMHDAMRRWTNNARHLQALSDALYVAINRANSAQYDGDMASEALQQTAIDDFVAEIERRSARHEKLYARLKAAYEATGREWPIR